MGVDNIDKFLSDFLTFDLLNWKNCNQHVIYIVC